MLTIVTQKMLGMILTSDKDLFLTNFMNLPAGTKMPFKNTTKRTMFQKINVMQWI